MPLEEGVPLEERLPLQQMPQLQPLRERRVGQKGALRPPLGRTLPNPQKLMNKVRGAPPSARSLLFTCPDVATSRLLSSDPSILDSQE